jgi:hypothetical protein
VFKRFLPLMIVFVLIFSSMPAFATDGGTSYGTDVNASYQTGVFKDTITVTNDGGTFKVGFATIVFKKDFLPADKLPATFNVEINVLKGIAGIEFKPNTPEFDKPVLIFVDSYKGLLYDITNGDNVNVDINKQVIVAKHFSRYAFR